MAEQDRSDRPRRPASASGPDAVASDLPLGEWISQAIDQARKNRDDPDPFDTTSAGDAPSAPAIGSDARAAAQRAAEASGLSVAEWIGRAIQDAAGPAETAADDGRAAPVEDSATGEDPLGVDAMSAARQAAESSGMSLNQWIGEVIREAQDVDALDDERAEDEDEAMRQAANRAAAAAGVPLGAWLRAAVVEASAEGEAPEPIVGTAGAPPVPARPAPGQDSPITAAAPAAAGHEDITRLARYLPLRSVEPGPFQAREDMDPAEIVTLSESIREKGVLQPILVRLQTGREDRYHIIAGERRWRASRMAGLDEIPAIVLDISDREAMQIALVENLVRRDLNPIEEAQGFRRLIDEFAHTQDELAELVGRSRSHVSNMLRLLRLPEDVQILLREGELSSSQGRALVNAPEASELARQVVERDLNVRQTEALVQRALGGKDKPEPPSASQDLDAVERSLTARLGARVKIAMRGERGTLSVRFRGQEGLDALLARLGEKE